MADFVFNVGRGRFGKLVQDGATIEALILKNAAADSVLRDLDTVAAVLANASTDEADFTNYERKTLTDSFTVDDANDLAYVDCDDIVWTSAGGASNNTTVKLIVYHDVDTTDANAIPILGLDFAVTTTGSDVTAQINANGLWRST